MRHMKPILQHAIAIEGSKVRLAAALGVEPNTITYWIQRKLPLHREEQLIKLYGKKKERKEWTPPK